MSSTLKLPWLTNTSFLLTISVQYQADKWLDKEKYQWEYYQLIQPQILQTNITRIVRQTVRRITNKFRKVRLFGKFFSCFIITITDPICLLGKWCVLFHKICFFLQFFIKILTKRNNFRLFVFLGRPSYSCNG